MAIHRLILGRDPNSKCCSLALLLLTTAAHFYKNQWEAAEPDGLAWPGFKGSLGSRLKTDDHCICWDVSVPNNIACGSSIAEMIWLVEHAAFSRTQPSLFQHLLLTRGCHDQNHLHALLRNNKKEETTNSRGSLLLDVRQIITC